MHCDYSTPSATWCQFLCRLTACFHLYINSKVTHPKPYLLMFHFLWWGKIQDHFQEPGAVFQHLFGLCLWRTIWKVFQRVRTTSFPTHKGYTTRVKKLASIWRLGELTLLFPGCLLLLHSCWEWNLLFLSWEILLSTILRIWKTEKVVFTGKEKLYIII